MHHALTDALNRGTPAVLVGSDCPVLDLSYLARAALIDHDAVFGPAEDGGAMLVGRRGQAFAGIAWSDQG
jgi:glycosyltransferase A (GT-A) superfamily protein (DUF2064 family)